MPTPQRLPIVNNDDGVWGDILRQYLKKEHTDDGTDNAANGGHQHITLIGSTGAAGTAPITFTAGTNLSTAVSGAMEYDGTSYYLTPSSATRKKIAIYNDASGATGDIYYRDSSGNFTRLAAATNGNILTLASGIPAWTASIVGMALNNTNTITVKDGSFTLQNSSDTTKQANFSLAGNTTATTRTYTLPDVTDTLAAKGRDVDPLWQRGGNLIYDGSFENTAAWAKAFGAMTTSQSYNGTQSRQLTATGAGVATDRLTLTHDSVGNPVTIELMPWAVTLGEIQIRKSASNTGSGNLYLRVRYKDNSGVEQLATSVTIAESAISSSSWSYFNNITHTNPQTWSRSYYFTLEIDSTVPSGNVYYVDQTDFVDIGLLSGWQGTQMVMQYTTLDNTNAATLKDSSLTLQNASDTTKQAKFSLASNTASTTRTYTMPDANTTIVGTDVTQTLTNKRVTPRIGTTTSSATPAINVDTVDQFNITALATAITSMTSGLTGTPTDGQKLMIRIKDNGSAQTITWGASFLSSGVATLPGSTVASKTHLVGFIYDSVAAKWICVAVDAVGY